jgi:hypothetical protein
MSKAWDIVGYTYNADTYCTGSCVTDAMGHGIGPLFADTPTEALLDKIAKDRGVNRQVERSFDSQTFPKVIFQSMVEGPELCGGSTPESVHWLDGYSPEDLGVDRCECGEWKQKDDKKCGECAR